MKNEVAAICPIYDMRGHLNLGVNLLRSKIQYAEDVDLYFVFSFKEHKDKFDKLLSSDEAKVYSFIMMPEEELKYKSQPTVKKLYAIRELKDTYKYLIPIDSESLFIKKGDYKALCDEIWESRSFLNANYSPHACTIQRRCFMTMGMYDNIKLVRETKYFNYNIWFNEIPVYKCELLNEFFDFLDSYSNTSWKNEWDCYDYYIFMAFLIIKKGYKLKRFKYEAIGGAVEYLPQFSEKQQYKILSSMQSHWSSSNVQNENTYMLFHLDRDEDNKNYGLDNYKESLRAGRKYLTKIYAEEMYYSFRMFIRSFFR